RTAVEAAAKRASGANQAARLSAQAVAEKLPPGTVDQTALVSEALERANAAWQKPDLTVSAEKAVLAETQSAKTPAGFAQSSPGMMVMFSVFSLVVSAMVLVIERKYRTLQRMLTTPIRRSEIIGGHLLAMFVVVLLQSAVLVALGQLGFGVNYMREPIGTLLMMAALGLWAASLGLLISALARQEEQVVMFSLIAMFAFAAFGGAWFPLEIAGQTFAAIGHLMPTAWAMDGFQNIVVRGLGLTSTLLPAGILLAYAAAFFVLAVWRFRYE
ncbi:MAG: ABC transporter permease, partial [Rudaea sp.]